MLHQNDPCCYYGKGRHGRIKEYGDRVEEKVGGTFATAVTDWNVHAVCQVP